MSYSGGFLICVCCANTFTPETIMELEFVELVSTVDVSVEGTGLSESELQLADTECKISTGSSSLISEHCDNQTLLRNPLFLWYHQLYSVY